MVIETQFRGKDPRGVGKVIGMRIKSWDEGTDIGDEGTVIGYEGKYIGGGYSHKE